MTTLLPPATAPVRPPLVRFAVRALCWSLVVLLVPTGAAVIVAVAYLTAPSVDRVAVLLAVAVTAGAGVGAAAGAGLARGLGPSRRTAALLLALVAALPGTGLLVVAGTDGRVEPVRPAAADPRGPYETWELSTGSRIAVWRHAADTPRHRTPVVFLHGGPGMYTQASRIAEGAPLRAAGFETVYFDQAGGGASGRLPVRQYTFARAVADVEALRVRLGSQRLVLWGNSYGAQLATTYTATHPDRVAALLLTSPGTFPGTPAERDYGPTNRAGDTELSGRLLLATLLIDRNPVLAEDLVGQPEAGAMLDAATGGDLAGGFVCKGADDTAVRTELAGGQGGNLFPNRMIAADVETSALPRSTVDVPLLAVRGACDFIPRASAERYLGFARSGRIVDVPDDGHGLRHNRAVVDDAVSRFAAVDLAHVA